MSTHAEAYPGVTREHQRRVMEQMDKDELIDIIFEGDDEIARLSKEVGALTAEQLSGEEAAIEEGMRRAAAICKAHDADYSYDLIMKEIEK